MEINETDKFIFKLKMDMDFVFIFNSCSIIYGEAEEHHELI